MENKLSILLKELEIASEDQRFYVKQYHLQVNFVYIYASIIIALYGLFKTTGLSIEKVLNDSHISIDNVQIIIFAILFLISLIADYLVATAMNSLYMAFTHARRRSSIEVLINNIFNENILVWDTKIIPRMYSTKFIHYDNWINPAYHIGLLMMLFFVTIHVILVIICYSYFPLYFSIFLLYSIIFVSFAIWQWLSLQTKGNKFITKIIAEETGLPYNFTIHNKEPDASEFEKSINNKIYSLPTILIIIIGVIGMAIASVAENSFFPRDFKFFSFIQNFSVIIGDALILPLFDYNAIKLCALNWDIVRKRRKDFIVIFAIIIIVSVLVQYSIHYFWSKESYASFLYSENGELTITGIWHLVYSIVQTIIILAFLVISYYSSNKKENIKLIIKSLKIFLVFSLIGIFDYFSKLLTVLQGVPFRETISHEFPTMLKLIFTGIIILYFYRKGKKKKY